MPTQKEILDAIPLDGILAEYLGQKLWPHLKGRGSSKGGPSACAYTAANQLGRLQRAGLVRCTFDRPTRWFKTKAAAAAERTE